VQPAGAQQPLTPVEPPERPPERPPDRPPIQEQPAAPVRSTGQPINDPDRPPEAVRPTNAGDATTSPHPASAAIWSPAYLVPPQAANEDGIVRMVTVALRSTGDKTRDVLRLRRIHGILTSYPGNDRFAFRVYEHARGYLLEFPNFTVGLCPEMLTRLNQMVGSENVQIEPITFQ
jgi:hypothetical protein